jgi:demethylmenaquinone methyltransferase / 2-methoxy-6-polyprenyl-1,4-benzoquinol methylase
VSINDSLADPVRKRALNRTLFGIVAPRYAVITRGLSFFQDRAWKKRLVGLLPPMGDNAVVLDIACGTGDIARLVAAANPGARVVGCDLTEAMLQRARLTESPANVGFSRQDMDALGLKPGCAACITGGYALRNAPDFRGALAQCHRALKTNGIAAFLDFSKSPVRIMAFLQITLLKMWGGLWGLMLHGRPWVYGYIGDSLKHFPDRKKVHASVTEAGFSVSSSRLFMFGLVELLIVRKNVPSLDG